MFTIENACKGSKKILINQKNYKIMEEILMYSFIASATLTFIALTIYIFKNM